MRTHAISLSLLLPFAACAVLPVHAQTPAAARIVYTFQHPQLQPPRYTITLDESGAGQFVSETGPAILDATDGVSPAPMNRPIRLDNDLRDQLFRYARAHRFFANQCATARTGLAFTGNKTLSYNGPDGHGSCAFIWAADPDLQRLSDRLEAVALTLEIGRRLEVEVRYDRLGLDSELESLQDAVKDHRASDLPNIAEDLQRIAEDQQVMDRARKRASALLSRCETTAKVN